MHARTICYETYRDSNRRLPCCRMFVFSRLHISNSSDLVFQSVSVSETLASADFWNNCVAIVKYPQGKMVIAHVISHLCKIKNPQKYLHI